MRELAERLRAEIEQWGSIRNFAKELTRRRVPGSSRVVIHRYIGSEENPPSAVPTLEFLRGAAALLGVRWEWLVTGEGRRTEADERMKEDALERLLEEQVPAYAALAPAVRIMANTVAAQLLSRGGSHPPTDAEAVVAVSAVLDQVFAAFTFWRREPPANLASQPFTDYAVTALHALDMASRIGPFTDAIWPLLVAPTLTDLMHPKILSLDDPPTTEE